MARYIITYDLNKPGQDYSGLDEKIKFHYPSCKRIMRSCWIIVTSATSEEIIDSLKDAIDCNDRLLVGPLGKPSAWKGLPDNITHWLQANA